MAGLIIPTPEVSDVKDDGFYDKNYPPDYKMPRQLIHVQRNKLITERELTLLSQQPFNFSVIA